MPIKRVKPNPLSQRMAKRRELLSKHVPVCPKCSHEKIQLIQWTQLPALWKCRKCEHPFTYEP